MTSSVMFSGIQPSGELSVGNYIGSLRNWVRLQHEHRSVFCVVNEHAVTVRQDPADLRRRTFDTLALFLAAGIDPEESVIFLQSQVPAHCQLGWVLECYTQVGELGRMTQFKDKAKRYADNITGGLYNYPVLMAADILLYQADLVPVGDDQRQHLELARDIAERFNALYGPTFTLPRAALPPAGARVMSLQEPNKKMSKSDANPNNVIRMLEEPAAVLKKIKRAVTDSDEPPRVAVDWERKPGVSNLLELMAAATDTPVATLTAHFDGCQYGRFKQEVGEAVVAMLEPVQRRYRERRADEDALRAIFARGRERAEALAEPTLAAVYDKIGFVR